MNTKKLALNSILVSAALIIFVIEAQLPAIVPVPGIKLGLANIITLVAIQLCGKKDAAAILFVRILLGSIFCGTPASFIYSISGGVFCLAIMFITSRVFSGNKLWASGVLGAIFHNIGQLIAAAFMLGSVRVLWYFPMLLLSAIITGAFTGLCAQYSINPLGKIIGKVEKK